MRLLVRRGKAAPRYGPRKWLECWFRKWSTTRLQCIRSMRNQDDSVVQKEALLLQYLRACPPRYRPDGKESYSERLVLAPLVTSWPRFCASVRLHWCWDPARSPLALSPAAVLCARGPWGRKAVATVVHAAFAGHLAAFPHGNFFSVKDSRWHGATVNWSSRCAGICGRFRPDPNAGANRRG